jgi:uncharacterized membrane protein YdbT with pleckstrin-like domain
MEEQQRYFYQPNPVSAVINWCWTVVILLIGIIVWLEITHFQWITAAFFAVFILLAFFQITRRTVLVTPTKLVFSRVLQKDYLIIPRQSIRQLRFSKHSMHMTVNGQTMFFSFMPNSLESIKQQLK